MKNWLYYFFACFVMCSCGGGSLAKESSSNTSSNNDNNFAIKWSSESTNVIDYVKSTYVLRVEADGYCYLDEDYYWESYTYNYKNEKSLDYKVEDTFKYRGTWELVDCNRGINTEKFVLCHIRDYYEDDEDDWWGISPGYGGYGHVICVDPSKGYVWTGQKDRSEEDCINNCINNIKSKAYRTEIQ